MAPIISVDINTRSLSARWDVRNKELHAVVRTGLEEDGYIVLTIDDNVSLAAQGGLCNFANLVDGRPSAGGSANPAFVKRLEHKTLLEHWPGEWSFLAETADAFAGIAEAVLRVCLHALSMPSNALAAILDDPDPLPNTLSSSHLQAISYSRHETIAPAAHVDRGLLTAVCDSAPGLQVQSKAGAWQPVMLKANQLAVFAGETLQHATAGRIPAAVHRVFLDPATNQTGVRQEGSSARVSLAYKQRPAEHAVIDLRNVPGFQSDSRWPHPLVVAHATALFEANHPSVNQPPADMEHQQEGQLQQPSAKRARTSSRGPRYIFVKGLDGKTIALELKPNMLIKELQEKVQDKVGLAPSQQRLTHASKQISDYPNRTLAEFNIQAEATLHLSGRLRGD